MRATRAVMGITLGLLITAIACDERTAEPASAVVVRDSAGIPIVENFQPAWSPAETPHLGAAPSLVIGDRPEAEYALSRIGGVARLADGRIVIGDGGSLQLKFFDSAGTFITSVGGRGNGPGEFRTLGGLMLLAGDTLAALSPPSTVSYFDPNGKFLRRVAAFDPARGIANGIKLVYAVMGDQSVVLGPPPSPVPPGAATRWVDSVPFSVLGRTTGTPTPLGVFPTLLLTRDDRMSRPPWFGPTAVLAAGEHSLYVGFGDAYSIRVVSRIGRIERIIRRRWTPVRVTQRDIDTYAADWVKHWGRGSSAEIEKQREDLRDDPYANEVPAFSQFIVDRTARLWVREPHLADAPGSGQLNSLPLVPSTWSVFDRDGRWLGDVTMPARFMPKEIGANYVLGVAVDVDGIETVVRYAYGSDVGPRVRSD